MNVSQETPPPLPSSVITSPVKKTGRHITSPSGQLTPVVVKILEKHGSPMKVAEIFEELQKDGYVWMSKNPRKILFIRMLRMPKSSGIVRVAGGKYGLATISIAPTINESIEVASISPTSPTLSTP